MIGNILYRGDSFGPIKIKHQNGFDSIIISFYFFELSSYNIVVVIHIEIKLQIFD